jgi:hypothetical protein
MAEQGRTGADQDRVLAIVARLVTAADGDTLYRDVYVRRAAELLTPLVSEAQYQSAITGRQQVTTLLEQARAAVGRQDWQRVRELGTRAADLQRSLEAEQKVLAAAEEVYGAPAVVLDPLSPGLMPTSKRWSGPAQARAEVSAALTELARDDPTARDLYASRQKSIGAVTVPGAATAPGAAPSAAQPVGNVEQQALQALERGDAAALRGLADSMLGAKTESRAPGGEKVATARGRIVTPGVLAEAFPEASVPRAKALGLECVEAKLASPEVAASIAEFMEQHAPGASAAAFDRARDGVARVTVAAEVAVPRDVAALFAETISLFALHLYVNSAGVRYVPVLAPREVLLVESHPEGEEPVTPLLRELGLERRRAVSRDEIEAALRKNGARVLSEHLGFDPRAFRIVCVPPDVYMRIGRERGWGKREEWTHFDGYQVLSGGRLRALVGGNARFGGLADLVSISRDDGRENTVVRLAVIHRERLGVRIA